jgi:putative peptidoglycan binding protein
MMASILERRVMRVFRESKYINTINIADQVHIDFVWYPGAAQATDSFVDTLIVTPEKGGAERTIEYQWARKGKAPVKRTMLSGRITIPLPPGASGILTVFDTSWQISRVPAATAMAGSATVTGIQQRLNALGYHLRTPGLTSAGVDGIAGRRTEGAILAFQVDYRPQAGVPVAAAKRLQVRGEWMNNASIAGNLNWYNQVGGGPANFNPSAGDSASLQASLVASAGA